MKGFCRQLSAISVYIFSFLGGVAAQIMNSTFNTVLSLLFGTVSGQHGVSRPRGERFLSACRAVSQ